MKIHPAIARNAAAVLNPAAQKSSSDASSPWAEIRACAAIGSLQQRTADRFTHAMTEPRSRTAASTPRTFAASTIVSTAESAAPAVRVNRWRQGAGFPLRSPAFRPTGLQTVAACKIVVNQSGLGAGVRCVSGRLQRSPIAAQPICFFHDGSPASESTGVSLCHRAPGCDLR